VLLDVKAFAQKARTEQKTAGGDSILENGFSVAPAQLFTSLNKTESFSTS